MMQADFASCRQVTAEHGRSFYFTSFALPAERRGAAFALYAFFRRLDDLFDLAVADHSRVQDAERVVDWLFSDEETAPNTPPWPDGELVALRESVRAFALTREPFDDMIAGMAMDLLPVAYADEAALELYCDRVAGTVGVLMAQLLGTVDPKALRAAQLMGRAMQLTNILRDVAEDLARGRVYLPSAELRSSGIVPSTLTDRPHSLRQLVRQRIQKARAVYADGFSGVPYLPTFRARWLVWMMGRIYGDILTSLERQECDVFAGRARVHTARKVWLALVSGWQVLFLKPVDLENLQEVEQ